jgi:hypothetical protein
MSKVKFMAHGQPTFLPVGIGPGESRAEQASRSWPFASTFLGGFECSSHRRSDGRRLDLLASTAHDRLAEEDYRSLMRQGIWAARDGIRWHLIETSPGRYDWSSLIPMLRAARRLGLQVVWDLCHYGWPDGLDIWSSAFVDRFARFAAEVTRVVTEESDTTPFFCPVNEISFWAWAGGEVGRFAPVTHGRGSELKRQLVRASIAGTTAVRSVAPRARFLSAEPLIHVAPRSDSATDIASAETYRLAQFEALDMISGRLAPELGGHPDLLDVVGVNFYPDNQWYHGGGTIPLGHHAHRPLRELLGEVYARYGRPIILAETGAEGTARPSWLHYVSGEVRAAQHANVPIQGICLYPVLDYPGWDNDRPCAVGLFSLPDQNGHRRTDPEFSRELGAQQIGLSRPRLLSTPSPVQIAT